MFANCHSRQMSQSGNDHWGGVEVYLEFCSSAGIRKGNAVLDISSDDLQIMINTGFIKIIFYPIATHRPEGE